MPVEWPRNRSLRTRRLEYLNEIRDRNEHVVIAFQHIRHSGALLRHPLEPEQRFKGHVLVGVDEVALDDVVVDSVLGFHSVRAHLRGDAERENEARRAWRPLLAVAIATPRASDGVAAVTVRRVRMDDDDEDDTVGACGPRRRYEDVREGVDNRLLPTVVYLLLNFFRRHRYLRRRCCRRRRRRRLRYCRYRRCIICDSGQSNNVVLDHVIDDVCLVIDLPVREDEKQEEAMSEEDAEEEDKGAPSPRTAAHRRSLDASDTIGTTILTRLYLHESTNMTLLA